MPPSYTSSIILPIALGINLFFSLRRQRDFSTILPAGSLPGPVGHGSERGREAQWVKSETSASGVNKGVSRSLIQRELR